jgi:NADH-quinone oxidoreductase subunit G
LRYQGVDTGDDSVNWGWMCDRGRFNFESVDSPARLAGPLLRATEGFQAISWGGAMAIAKQLVEEAATIGVLGGARTTNEGALAWARLADALDVEYRDAQLGDGLPAEVLGLPRATVDDAAGAATVILLGPDIKEELPVLYLRLRDASEQKRTRIIEFSSVSTGLSRYAWRTVRYLPGAGAAEIQRTLADTEVAAQLGAGDVVVVAGRGNLAESEAAALASLRAVLDAVPNAQVLPALRRGNVVGALELGLAPADADHDAIATLRAAADGKLDLLVLLGADPLNDCPDATLARRALAGARRILSIDTFLSDSTQQADLVLAAAAFGEQDGTTTNLEGRVSPVAQAVTAHGTARPDWMIAAELALMFGRDIGFDTMESAAASVAGADRRQFGPLPEAAASEPPPNSYDYRIVVSRKLYDRAVGTSNSPSLARLAPGPGAHIHPLDLDRVGVAEGTDVKLVGTRGSIVLPLIADEAVQRGTLWSPFNQEGADITDLVEAGATVTDVRIERL